MSGLLEHNTSICQDSISICGRASSHKIQVNRSRYLNQIIFQPQDTNHIDSYPSTKTKSSATPRTEIKSMSTTQTTTKSKSMPELKPSDSRPASRNRANVDDNHPHKNQVDRSSHQRSPHLEQVNIGPHMVNFDPPHKKQVTFDPNPKTKSNSIRHTNINSISTPPPKLSQFNP